MTTSARFDLKLDPADKELLARASTLTGTTMAGFVRAAARARAQEVIDRETRLNMSQRDLVALSAALEKAFEPNPALKEAIAAARHHVKRA